MDTKSLADMSAGLREKHEKQSPDRTGPKGCPSRKLSSSFSSTEYFAGGQAGGQHPLRHLPESDVVAKRDGAKNDRQIWRRRHGQASQRPFMLRDIAEERPHGPDVLLLIPLKLRDGKHALSSIRPPLASILLASNLSTLDHPVRGSAMGNRRKHCKLKGG